MIRAEGDSVKAEQLLDCRVFEYYYRIYQYKMWGEKREKDMKKHQSQ